MVNNALSVPALSDPVNNYKYNGKELQKELSLGWLDYGTRFYDPVIGRWHSVDPMAEKYIQFTSYIYCGDNPMNLIDLDGMDWYQWKDKDGNQAVAWQEGNAKSVELYGQTYNNIGTTYTQNIGKNITVTFTQNEATSMTFKGADNTSWVSQITNGINCYQASSQMLKKEGVATAGIGSEIIMTATTTDGTAGRASTKANKGIAVIDQNLENGNPSMVGVDYKPGSPNADGKTDHFIVISSKTESLNNGNVISKTYNYFDPRTKNPAWGTSNSNQLTVKNNRLVGTYNHGVVEPLNYTVTTVRRNM
ncbi:MAG: RHS repeat-associated core domain-containing protein [Bacteroidota bacterium]|nr:RHS repeat-associated core domain-containing protein [Bacteroidota bacterium]